MNVKRDQILVLHYYPTFRMWAETIVKVLKENDIRSISFLPDTVIGKILNYAVKDGSFELITLAREEEGVGIVTGEYLGGRRGVLMMQSAGLGNSVNALASLAIPYQIPFLLLISQRGELGEFNACHVTMGKALRRILDALGIQHFTLRREDEVEIMMQGAIKTAYASEQPVAVILSSELVGWKDEK
ncbi:MAG TPA: thiamine pyrophosphate-binding protein [Candidatus Limnocylindrales bacterium]|nr:thiamine pyrophosphate-binding protein [Candidatus Limnocylindrales bacterium]